MFLHRMASSAALAAALAVGLASGPGSVFAQPMPPGGAEADHPEPGLQDRKSVV